MRDGLWSGFGSENGVYHALPSTVYSRMRPDIIPNSQDDRKRDRWATPTPTSAKTRKLTVLITTWVLEHPN